MKVSDFSYDLPPELIAQNPAEPRDSARLLVYRRDARAIEHKTVRDLPDLLAPNTLLVANNSKVRRSRLRATRENGSEAEILVLEREGSTCSCMLRGRRIRVGEMLSCPTGGAPLQGTITGTQDVPGMRIYTIRFEAEPSSLEAIFEAHGEMPLPPYITESKAEDGRYQTVFASELGSAAAPTAGLHFTPELIARLREKGNAWDEVTLHVGMGTFLPLREDELEANRLHREATFVSEATAAAVNAARAAGRTVLAVGTTSTRTLESHSGLNLEPGAKSTDMFIYPGYRFKTVNALLTNFHLPNSSLLALVAAFIGNDAAGNISLEPAQAAAELKRVYEEAVRERYRFFSFGDAMLLL